MKMNVKKLSEELQVLGDNLQDQLEQSLRFNRKLAQIDERTLRLFITMTTDPLKFEKALRMLEDLEKILPQEGLIESENPSEKCTKLYSARIESNTAKTKRN